MTTTTPECLCMEMGNGVTDCVPSPFDTDVWTQATRHGPGQQAGPVHVVNRSVIYRLLPPEGDPFLVVLNGLWPDTETDQPFEGLRTLEKQTGARIRFILAPGGQHHLSLPAYAAAFPDARVCVPEGRIPRENPELMQCANVESYPLDQPPPELEPAGLRLRVVRGLMEGDRIRRVQLISAGRWGYTPDSTEPVVALHLPTGTLTSGGHQWWFLAEGETAVFHMPGPMRLVTRLLGVSLNFAKPGQVTLEQNHMFAVQDRAALQASCAEILSWDFDQLVDLHAHVDTCPRSGAKAMYQAALAPIAEGRWDEVPWRQAQQA